MPPAWLIDNVAQYSNFSSFAISAEDFVLQTLGADIKNAIFLLLMSNSANLHNSRKISKILEFLRKYNYLIQLSICTLLKLQAVHVVSADVMCHRNVNC